jgi:hypothetical protein
MPGVVLHVIGEEFDPQSVLPALTLRPYAIFRKGDRCFPDNPRSEKRHSTSGVKCEVSSVDGNLEQEIRDATEFLKKHRDDLARFQGLPGVESMYLDFGYYLRVDGERCVVQCDYLPPELLRLAGELGMGIELSLYPKPGPGHGSSEPLGEE